MPLNQRLRLPQPVTRHRSLTPPAHDRSDLVYLMDVKHRRRRKRSQPRAALAAVTPNRGVLDATAREVGVRIVGGDHAAQGVAVQGVQLDGRFLLLYCQSETGRVLEVQVSSPSVTLKTALTRPSLDPYLALTWPWLDPYLAVTWPWLPYR